MAYRMKTPKKLDFQASSMLYSCLASDIIITGEAQPVLQYIHQY